ncbi:MAG TPA: hypothetical protein VF381_06140, partial [Thermoanaerobaculia bacterium]
MNLAISTLAATVHFVGIIAFLPEPDPMTLRSVVIQPVSEQRLSGPEDHGVRLAGIRLPVSTPTPIGPRAVLAVIPQDFPTSIPAHTAMIIYRTSDYLASSPGLTRANLTRPGLQYVKLNDGDIVTFDTGGATNPPASFPTGLPHHPARSSNTPLNILAPYDPSNRANASLVRIATGTVTVCRDNGRYDTNVVMTAKNSFVIKISTKTTTKTLTLGSAAEVSIV